MNIDKIHVAIGILRDKESGLFFVGKRKKGKPFEHYYEFPGGKREPGESMVEALKRELKEELGLSIDHPTFLLTYEIEGFSLHFFYKEIAFTRIQNLEYETYETLTIEALAKYPMLPHNQPIYDFLRKYETLLGEDALHQILYSENVLLWYDLHKRDLAFRLEKNPYFIWVSEIMLQQTQMNTVLPYYKRFIEAYPTLEALAKTSEEKLLNLWAGLGYYYRAKNLLKGAKLVVDQLDGKIPTTYEALLEVPGIGPYTAGAIASIAFNQCVPAIDGNVLRIFARVLASDTDIKSPKAKAEIEEKLSPLIPKNRPGDFNEALMDLGSMICLKSNPLCDRCPLSDLCIAFLEGKTDVLPVVKKAPKKKIFHYQVALLTFQGRIFLEKRGDTGLLPNLYGLPIAEKIEPYLQTTYALKIDSLPEKKLSKTHIFTHQKWEMDLYQIPLNEKVETDTGIWVLPENLDQYGIPNAFLKLLKSIEIF